MADATATDVFKCSVSDFYKIITDFSKYPEFLSEVKSCNVIDEQGGRKLVEYEVSVIKTIKYTLWMTEIENVELSWELAGGDMFKTNKGYWKLKDEAGKCRATYFVDCSFKLFVPGPIAKTLVQVNLPNMMSSYHKRVSELYGV
jgi:ribosome-associated toxin RatA of RatAB toxin-antitoxin module